MVWVKWEDACVKDEGTWASNEEHKYEPQMMHTVGFLLSDTEEGVIITGTWSDDTLAPRDQIPRGMIREIGPLKALKEKKCK